MSCLGEVAGADPGIRCLFIAVVAVPNGIIGFGSFSNLPTCVNRQPPPAPLFLSTMLFLSRSSFYQMSSHNLRFAIKQRHEDTVRRHRSHILDASRLIRATCNSEGFHGIQHVAREGRISGLPQRDDVSGRLIQAYATGSTVPPKFTALISPSDVLGDFFDQLVPPFRSCS